MLRLLCLCTVHWCLCVSSLWLTLLLLTFDGERAQLVKVHVHVFQGNFNITIQVPTLKRLQLCCINYFESSSPFKVYINTPSLECFTFEGHLGKTGSTLYWKTSPTWSFELVLAVRIVDGLSIEDYAKRLRDLIRPFVHIKSLGMFTETTGVN